MKEITINDCIELRNKFEKYCETAEQHESVMLIVIESSLKNTVDKMIECGKVDDQQYVKTIFRLTLKAIGEDYSDFEME